MRRLFLVLGALACLVFILVVGFFIVLRVETAPVSEAETVGAYEVANWAITDWGDGATLTLNKDNTYVQSIRLKKGGSRDSSGTYAVVRVGSYLSIRFFNFELIPSFGFGASPDHWATSVWRNWRGRVQFCYDSDVGYCYVKKD
jgi:hypothetical protein